MRPLEEIMKDLTSAANDIASKRKAKEDLDKAQSVAMIALDEAEANALALRAEMEEFLNLLVPSSSQGRNQVR